MQEVGGAGRLSEDGCASAYKDSLNCALRIERKRENATREKQRAATRRNGADWVDRRSPPFLDLLFLPSKKKKKKKKKKTSGLDKNGYDKSKCEDFFERYKACKTVEYEARRKARVDARRGRKKEQQPAGG